MDTLQTEDKILAVFATGGIVTIAASILQASPDPRLASVGGLLVAIGAVLKAIWPRKTP